MGIVNHLKDVRKTDDYTIEIELDEPYYPVLYEIAFVRPFRFLGDNGFPDNGQTTETIKEPIGTGPWVLKERTIIVRHVLKNALIPVISSLGMTIGNLLGGSVIVEQVFAWPGLGRFLIDSIINRDYPVIQCYVLWDCWGNGFMACSK